MPFPPNFDHTWDETFPPDTQLANLLGQDIRNFKLDIRERVSLISGTFVNRPTPDASWGGAGFGMIYFSTDTGQLFQWNGAAWTDITSNFLVAATGTNRAPNIVASIDLTGKTAAIGSTLLYSVPANAGGIYEIFLRAVTTVAAAAGNIQPQIQWTDSVLTNTTFTDSVSANFQGENLGDQPSVAMVVKAGTNINYSVIFNAVSGVPTYELHGRLVYYG